MSHTPGPWVGDKSTIDEDCTDIHGDGEAIATVHGMSEQAQADARLIAAAPDLLAVAKKCRDLLPWLESMPLKKELNATIAAAEASE